MENGNRSGLERTSPSLDCDVGLGLKPTESSTSQSCKRQMVLPPPHYHLASSQTSRTTSFTGGGGGATGGGGGGPLSYQVPACGSDIYEPVCAVLPNTFHNVAFKPSGVIPMSSGKTLFTASQWQELERQNMIHKYITASTPVPPQLLLPISKTPSLAPLSQSNTSGLDLRFSTNGLDPEPWRCRRTDGKKWRCSRDVAPDHKYCERHAHKNKPRSRKHVEVQSHDIANNYSQQSLLLPSNIPITAPQPLQSTISHFPTVASATSHDQARCIEWFMRSGTIPVSTCNQQQWQQVTPTSSKFELDKDNRGDNNNVSVVQPHHEDKQGFISMNPYILDSVSIQRLESHHRLINGQSHNSFLDPKSTFLQGSLTLNADKTQTTRHFIDGLDGIGNQSSTSALNNKYFSPSLTLSMSDRKGIDEDSEDANMGIIMMNNSDRDGPNGDGILKAQWENPVSWMNSPPGGPLGEALCLGSANTTNSPTPHGNSSSNCSKSYCEDGSHAHNFIG